VKRLNSREFNESTGSLGKNEIEQLIMEKDDAGRTPIDLACYLGFKNIALYLTLKMGSPQTVIHQDINVDKE
jgi:hypothetical protein